MDWLLHQLERFYALEQRTLRTHVQTARDAMRQHLTDTFDAAAQDGTWNADDVNFNVRMRRLHDLITILLASLLTQVQTELLTYETAAYRLGYYGTAWQMDANVISMLHDREIQDVMQAPYIDATLTQRMFDVQTQFEMQFRREMTQSQTEGENLTQATRRINGLFGVTFPSGAKILSSTGFDRLSIYKSLWFRIAAIALSEFWRAGNLGTGHAMGDNAGMLAGKQWHTSELPNVCRRCNKLKGAVVPLDADFIDELGGVKVKNAPLHPVCNCFTLPVLKDGQPNTESYAAWLVRRNVQADDGRGMLG